MDKTPKISVIVPVKNAAQFLEQTILSILNQNYAKKEIIIVDNNSSDETSAIIKKFPPSIIKHIVDHDSGTAEAMNKGLLASSGDFITFLGADDYFIDYSIFSKVVDIFNKNQTIDIVHAPIRLICRVDEKFVALLDSNTNNLLRFMSVPFPGTFFRKQTVFDKRQFDKCFKRADDYEFMLSCLKDNLSFYKIDLPYLNFRQNGHSSALKARIIVLKEAFVIRLKYAGVFSALRGEIIDLASLLKFLIKRCF